MTVKILRWIIQRDPQWNYNKLIFRLEVQNINKDEWHWQAMLMFTSEQIIDILNEFDVDTLNDLVDLKAEVLPGRHFTSAPHGIRSIGSKNDFIITLNQDIESLW